MVHNMTYPVKFTIWCIAEVVGQIRRFPVQAPLGTQPGLRDPILL